MKKNCFSNEAHFWLNGYVNKQNYWFWSTENLNISISKSGGGRNFERRNLERLTFRNFKIVNIEIPKDEVFDSFIIEFILSLF